MPEEFSLGLTEVDVAVRRAGLPTNWQPFEVRIAAADDYIDTLERARTEAWEALRARRLADRDKLDVEVAQTLRAWTQPDVLLVVQAVESADGRKVFYRVTIGEGLGVFSEQAGDEILFSQVRPERLVDMVVGMLPDYGPVPLRELVITRDTRLAPARGFADEEFIGDPSGPTTSEHESAAMAEFAQWPLHRYGTFELSVRHGHSSLHQVGMVTFVDNGGGRFLMFSEPLAGGATRLRLVPSDGSHLRNWLHQSIADHR